MYFYYEDQNQSRLGYYGLSFILHVALAASLALVISMQVKKTPPPVLIEFEVIPSKGVQTDSFSKAAPAQSPEMKSQDSKIGDKDAIAVPVKKLTKKVATKLKEKPIKAARIAKKSAVKLAKAKVPKASTAFTKTSAKAKTASRPSVKSAPKVVALPSRVEPITQEFDEPAPEIPVDDGKDFAALNSDLSDSEMGEDLREIESKTALSDESEKKLLAAMEAEESKVAEEGEALIAAEKARLAQQARANSRFGRSSVSAGGDGSSPSAQNGSNNSPYGVPQGVRRLEQLKQVLGNRKPEYSFEDRRAGRQGNVVYYAYINNQGYPIKFNKMRSTGYESLDNRTLEALKKWKFYPGQEGWVELPFIWSLKGGMVEAPSTLRRSLSQR